MANARETALKTLIACRRANAWSDAQLKRDIAAAELDARDAALATRLCYTVMQNRILLDYYISRFSAIKPEKLEPRVLDILRLGAAQLWLMDKIPVSAAVNESVELAKKGGNKRGASFVNAVLRAMSRAEGAPRVRAATRLEELSVKYSHPLWLTELMREAAGDDGLEALLAANNAAPAVIAQVNTLKTTMAQASAMLEAEGVEVTAHEWLPGCLELRSTGDIERLEAFREGHIMVQDCGARLCVDAAEPEAESFVIDCCAAPGGKSFAAAMKMQNTGRILSCDIHKNKVAQIALGADRLGITTIECGVMDARVRAAELVGAADTLIADVPCSGLGVIRKKPDIRYKAPEDIERLPQIQLDILRNVSAYVRPGGTLLYSTCTINRAENEGVVERFLRENADFAPESFTLPGPAGEVKSGMICLMPHLHGTDGFFICKLRKKR